MMQTRRGCGLFKAAAGVAGLVAVAAGAHHLMGGGCPLGLFPCDSKAAAGNGAAVTAVSIQSDECPLTGGHCPMSGGSCPMSGAPSARLATSEADCFALPDEASQDVMIVGPEGIILGGSEQTASNAGK